MGWKGRGHSAKLNTTNVWLVRVNFIKCLFDYDYYYYYYCFYFYYYYYYYYYIFITIIIIFKICLSHQCVLRSPRSALICIEINKWPYFNTIFSFSSNNACFKYTFVGVVLLQYSGENSHPTPLIPPPVVGIKELKYRSLFYHNYKLNLTMLLVFENLKCA